MVAYNEIGPGLASQASEKIIAATIPSQPAAPTLVSQSKTAIEIAWTAPENGGSPLISYEIHWNGGSGSTFSPIATHTDLLNLAYTKDNNLAPGNTYEFKVIA